MTRWIYSLNVCAFISICGKKFVRGLIKANPAGAKCVLAQLCHKMAAWYSPHVAAVHDTLTALLMTWTLQYQLIHHNLWPTLDCACLVLSWLLSSLVGIWPCNQPYMDHFPWNSSVIFNFPSNSIHFLSHFWLSCSPIVRLLCPWTVSECVSYCFPFEHANSSTQQSL